MSVAGGAESLVEHVDCEGVVVGDDGSPVAGHALRWAARYAATSGLPLHVVHAWTLTTAARLAEWTPEYVPSLLEFQQVTRAFLHNRVAAELGRDHGSLTVQLHTVHGPAAQSLLGAVERAELLVVGWRGRGGLLQRLPGSVATQVLREAPCSITLVRPHVGAAQDAAGSA